MGKLVGKATGLKVGRCQQIQMSELFFMEKCDQMVMDFLAATDIGKFPPKLAEEPGHEEHMQLEHKQEVHRPGGKGLDQGRSLSHFLDLFVSCFLSNSM
jgi:hypothetical protein